MSIKPLFFEGKLGRQDREKVVFVEGTDDAYFLDAILEDIGADPKNVGVLVVDGVGNFASAFLNYSKSSAFRKATGVLAVRDADQDPGGAEAELRSGFEKAFKVNVSSAEIVKHKNTSFAQLIVPSALENGELEKLCLDTVSTTDLYSIANKCVTDAYGINAFTQIDKRKAQVFLATFPDVLCRGAGMGFRRGYFDKAHPSLDDIKDFIKKFLDA